MVLRKKVLVVDDDAAFRDGLTLALKTRGFEVASAGTVAGAVAEAEDFSPDAVLCDWQLSDEDGDGVSVVRHFSDSADVTIIMFTARELSELKQHCDDVPVKAFLRKPVSLAAIFELLD